MIRQAISCDICASEKRQTNHWFVAYEQGGELRVSGWSSRHRLRPGSKHLCGQTCLHKLVDEFMAKSIAVRTQRAAEVPEVETPIISDASLTSHAAHVDLDSSARLLTAPAVILPRPTIRPQPEIVSMPRSFPAEFAGGTNEMLAHSSRSWHVQAWERERERELRAIENHPDIAARRRSSA